MAKNEDGPKTIAGHSVEDLYKALRTGKSLPGGVCLDYDKDPIFFNCKDYEPEPVHVTTESVQQVVDTSEN